MDNKFCKIYVSDYVSKNNLLEGLSSKLGGSFSGNEIILPECEIYVEENDDFNIDKQKEFPDGFLFYPYFLEIDFKENASKEYCISFINDILQWFWNKSKPAVAVCDYEMELLHQGGYKSTKVPFKPKRE